MKTKIYKIKFIKETELNKIGDIVNCSKKSAEHAINASYAEYVEEPKKKVKKKTIKKKVTNKQKIKVIEEKLSDEEIDEELKRLLKLDSLRKEKGLKSLSLKSGYSKKTLEEQLKHFKKLQEIKDNERELQEAREWIEKNETTISVSPQDYLKCKKNKCVNLLEYYLTEYNKKEVSWKEHNQEFKEQDIIITFINEKYEEPKEEEKNKSNNQILINKISRTLKENYTFKTIYTSKGEKIFIFEEGIYKNKGNEIIKTRTESILKNKCSNRIVSEVLGKIQRTTSIDIKEFEKIPEDLQCFENGILNLKTLKFEEHNKKYYFREKIPLIYDPHKKCPKILKFIKSVLYKEDIPVIQEWFGFCLYRKYFIKKGIILVGPKDTSKTVTLNLLIKFIGEKNKSGISLQKISNNDKVSIAHLHNKLLNIYDDLSFKDLSDNAGFKIATGGGYITGEKKFEPPFEFIPFAKQTFATNKIPSSKDNNDDAYYDRWMPIRFDNIVDKKNQNKFLIEELITNEELSGILNWALEGLKRLFKKGEFSFNKSTKDIKKIMERSGNPLNAFVQDVLTREDGYKITKEEMYEIYSYYVNKNELPRLSKEQLGRQLGKYASFLLSKRDNKLRYWENGGINKGYLALFTHKQDTIDTLENNIRNSLDNIHKNNEIKIVSIS